jgi:hypothetical protein
MRRKTNSIKRIFPLSLICLSPPFRLLSRVLRQWLRPKLQPDAHIMQTLTAEHMKAHGFVDVS